MRRSLRVSNYANSAMQNFSAPFAQIAAALLRRRALDSSAFRMPPREEWIRRATSLDDRLKAGN
jgi:hypothetical protein